MALVSGTLSDFAGGGFVGLNPEVVFVPSGPGARSGSLFATRPIVSIPNGSGAFSVDLQSTDDMDNLVWYMVQIRWLNPAGAYISADFPQWRIRVPIAGGVIGDLIDAQSNPAMVWIGEGPPPGPVTDGTWWLVPSTGELLEWSN